MNANKYSHTQVGWVIFVCLWVSILITVFATLLTKEFVWVVTMVIVILFVCLINFATLTIRVDREKIRLYFGPGLVRKTFPISEVLSSRVVSNPWSAGWGIRLTRGGWLFNVSGTHGVELEMKSGAKHRLGTDQPEELDSFIKQMLAGG